MPVLGGKLAPPPKTNINKHKHIRNHSENKNLRHTYSVLNVANGHIVMSDNILKASFTL